eukprot:c29235_g1_i6 orf=142-498(+)
MAQYRFSLGKSVERSDGKVEKPNCNRVLSEELEARFVQYCQGDLWLDEVTKRDALRLFHETKSLLFAGIGALGSGTEDEIGRLWSAYILYYSLKFNSHVHASGEKEKPACHATKFTLS